MEEKGTGKHVKRKKKPMWGGNVRINDQGMSTREILKNLDIGGRVQKERLTTGPDLKKSRE